MATANQINIPGATEEEKKKTYAEWAKHKYDEQYESWVPWLEDMYLRYFTKENKASYTAKQNLDKTKVTGIKQVDTLQDGVNNLAAGQVGQGGLLEPVGNMTSKEGVNRLERQGKDNKGGYVPAGMGPVSDAGNAVAGSVNAGGKQAAAGLQSGAKSVGGVLGFGKEQK